MEVLNIEQFQSLLAHSKGAKIITLIVMTKADIPTKEVYKLSRVNGIVNFQYSNSVNRQREREEKEPDFVPKKRKWGTRLSGLPFVSHVTKDGNHRLYLEVKVERVLSTEYRNAEGKTIPEEEITPLLKGKKSQKEHQGVEKEVVLRDYDVANILGVTINGVDYIINHGVKND
jgi:hypothetical protein